MAARESRASCQWVRARVSSRVGRARADEAGVSVREDSGQRQDVGGNTGEEEDAGPEEEAHWVR